MEILKKFLTKKVDSRIGYKYLKERITPIREIPLEFQFEAKLPGEYTQVVDRRLCYNYVPPKKGILQRILHRKKGKLVECGSVWSHAENDGFVSPES